MLKVDMPKNQSSIIKVIGVGGGGSNAVNYMYKKGITGVDFIVCNTDAQALEASTIPTKIQLGKGLGAGNIPQVAEKAAIEKSEEIKAILEKNTQMLFITAGMGGGTGTGAAPVIAELAKEIDLPDEQENKILTVAIVTLPFSFEGKKRREQAEKGIEQLKKYVDAILVINNDKLRDFGNLPMSQAFEKADNVLTTAAKGIAEIITEKAYVNIDFRDVNTVMKNSGVALMGSGVASGENRAFQAVELAINSPLLNDNNIKGAKNILLYLSFSMEHEITMDEITEITDYINNEACDDVNVIWGAGYDDNLGEKLSITLIATGFDKQNDLGITTNSKPEKKVVTLDIEKPEPVVINPPKVAENNVDLEDIKIVAKEEEPVNIAQKEEVVNSDDNQMQFVLKTPAVQSTEEKPVVKSESLTPAEKPSVTQTETNKETAPNHEQIRLNNERIERLKELSMKLKTTEGLTELENKPAYIRRNVVLNEVTPSSESEISRYTLETNPDNTIEIKPNNKFLHDNVD